MGSEQSIFAVPAYQTSYYYGAGPTMRCPISAFADPLAVTSYYYYADTCPKFSKMD